jgi:hypothetical protein
MMSDQIITTELMETQEAFEELTNNFGWIIANLNLIDPLSELSQSLDCYKRRGSGREMLRFEFEPKETITKAQIHFFNTLVIAARMANMPSKSLQVFAYTEDLEDEWQYQRKLSKYQARCFIIACLNLEINPLRRECQPEMSELDRELCLQKAYSYRALWDLLQAGWSYITNRVSDLPFHTDVDLFCEIVGEEINCHFEMRISEFCQILTEEYEVLWGVVANPEENRDLLNRLIDSGKVRVSKWLEKISPILAEASKNDENLRAKLVAHASYSKEFALLMADALSSRNSKGKRHKSEQWRHGRRNVLHRNKPRVF